MASEVPQITSVRIEHYRSIVDETFNTNRLNLLVGLNDAGKSNVLRALDLFFNDSAAACPFVFKRDFCQHDQTARNKAKECRITLTLNLPATYDAKEVQWKKVWRSNGAHGAGLRLCHKDGTELKARSRVPAALQTLRFEYVPAVKGQDYFEKLLKALHDVLVQTVAEEIRTASGGFTSTINEQTRSALNQIESKLGIKSSIELPSDLRELFSRLEFRSQGNVAVSLAERGDGVKARHIPILLHYIAQQSRMRKIRGTPQTATIWGFEEPENNLEMIRAAELARDFVEYSKEIQIFATTHSPVFYSLGTELPEASVFLVAPHGEAGTKIHPIDPESLPTVDEHVGLLPLVAPYIKRAAAERDDLLQRLEEIGKLDKPSLLLEGKSDVKVFKKAFEFWYPSFADQVQIRSQTGAGAAWVMDQLIAHAHANAKHRALGIVDKDQAGNDARRDVSYNKKVQSVNKGGTRVKAICLEPPPDLRPLFSKGLNVSIGLEELFPIKVWKHAEAQGWLVPREDIMLTNSFKSFDRTFEDHCRLMKATEDEIFILLNKVPNEHKDKFSKYACSLCGTALKAALLGFLPSLSKVAEFFKLSDYEDSVSAKM